MKSLTPAVAFAAALLASSAATASTVGLPGTAAISTTFDTFPSANFTGASPDSATTQFTSTLGVTSTGGLLLGGGQRIYSGGNATTINISGTSTTSLTDLQLVLKFTAPSVGSPADFYNVSLNGNSTAATFFGTVTEGSNTFVIYEYTWTNLNIASGSNFSVVANGGADHVSLDAIQLSAVPEASTSVLGALAAGGLLLRRNRRRC